LFCRSSKGSGRVEAPKTPAEKFVEKAQENLDLSRKSVDDAASVSGTLWFSYLFALFYIGIAAGGVTHKDLLLENPVRLPFLNIELPLVAFFFLAPILFVISHAYTLMQFVLLAGKVGDFNSKLGEKISGTEDARRQLPSNIFVQILAGPRDIRKGGLGFLLKSVAWISLVIGPILLLLLIQIQFLPYHLEWVTWVQRFALLADVALLWALWPAVLEGRSAITCPKLWRHPFLVPASVAPIAFAFIVARFPGEGLDEWVGKHQWIPPNPVTAWLGAKDRRDVPVATSFHHLLFRGKVDRTTRRRESFFSNTLVLPGFDGLAAAKVDDPGKVTNLKQTLSLRGRNLEGVIFDGADLRKADLSYAGLQRAVLDWAQLEGADLVGAELQGASLDDAHLQGASLSGAHLQGASLDRAYLQGASLNGAHLQGASLAFAHLQGAWLQWAAIQGAWLVGAHLQGASLDRAYLQGASLNEAQLQGASLREAAIQGASFIEATLVTSDLDFAAAWRANFEDATFTSVLVEDALFEDAISNKAFKDVVSVIKNDVPQGWARHEALNRVAHLDPDLFGPEASVRKTLESGFTNIDAYRKELTNQLKNLVCSGDKNAPFVVRGLGANGRLKDTGPFAPALIEKILSPECPVSAALTEQDKANLRKLAKEALSHRLPAIIH
jgi:uncharacterized protein YjbI with pentapeptide repeats